MSDLFRRLPGFRREPPGFERKILAALPRLTWIGTLVLALPLITAVPDWWMHGLDAGLTRTVIYAIAAIVLHWTVVFTVGLAAFIVMLMKGPAYVWDAYPLDERDRPAP